MKIKPLWQYVVIEPVKEKEISDGGIHLPETKTKSQLIEGKIITVAKGIQEVKAGDIVAFDEFAGEQVDGKYIIHVEDLKYIKEVSTNGQQLQSTNI